MDGEPIRSDGTQHSTGKVWVLIVFMMQLDKRCLVNVGIQENLKMQTKLQWEHGKSAAWTWESSMQWNMKQVNYTLTSLANRNGLEFDTFSQKIMFSMQDPKTKNSWCQNREGYSKSNTCVQFINDQIVWPRIQGQSFNTMITIIYVKQEVDEFYDHI